MRSIITNTVTNNSDPGFWTASDLPILKTFTTYSEQINTVLYLNAFYFKGSKFSLICNRKCALDLHYASFKRVLKGGRESWIKKNDLSFEILLSEEPHYQKNSNINVYELFRFLL